MVFLGWESIFLFTLTGRVGLLDGQDTMKGAARVYTSSRVKGTSNGDGKGLSVSEARI